MTLSKQLIALISLIFIAIFLANLKTSTDSIQEYLQKESQSHARSTAISLGLTLKPYISDDTDIILETMVNAVFDSGFYQEIAVSDPAGKVLITKTNPTTFQDVPLWFTDFFQMDSATAEQDISEDQGDKQLLGHVKVTVHKGMGYLKLWEQAKQTFIYSIVMLAIFIVVLVVALRVLLNPLARIENLARQIADGEFNLIDKLPGTIEIRNVAQSMNLMSGKLEKVISNLNKRLEESGKKLSMDPLTGLDTRPGFETSMKQRFMAKGQGFILIIKIFELGPYASKNSPKKVDEFIKHFVLTIKNVLKDQNQEIQQFFRIMGSEFVLLVNLKNREQAEILSGQILNALAEMGKGMDKPNVAHIGGVMFDPHGTTAQMIAAANEAYEKACLVGDNSYVIAENSGNSYDSDEWKEIVRSAIDNDQVELSFTAQAYSLANKEKLLLEETMSRVLDNNGDPLAIGTFISIAEKIDRIADFDMLVINKVIDHIRLHNVTYDIAINLSFTTLANGPFLSSLAQLLKDNNDIAHHLVFSVTAYGAAKDTEAFSRFIDFAHRNGAKVILKRYESKFLRIDQIKAFKLDYIRLARVYTEKISIDAEKRDLVKAVKEMGDLLDISILAEAVESDSDYEAVREIGLDGASR